MANFLPGQKLTAADLNNAFQQVAGVQNPSNDYQWTKTSLGNLQSLWSTYTNTQNQLASPLDIDIGVKPLETPLNVPALGGSINAERCVFLNVGDRQTSTIGDNTPTGVVYPFGQINNQFFIGIVGFQIYHQDAPIAGDGKAHFSLFSEYGNQPATDTPAAWEASEKLWQTDICRNANKNRWWWTGISLEHIPTNMLSSNLMSQLVAWPIFLEYTTIESGNVQAKKTAALLAVSTYLDYVLRPFIMLRPSESLYQTLANSIQTYIMPMVGGDGATTALNRIYYLDDPKLVTTIASYVYSGKTTNAFFKQQSNFVHFTHDFSESHLRQYLTLNSAELLLEGLQCVRHDGAHIQMLSADQLMRLTDNQGTLIVGDYATQYLVAVADSSQLASPVLSCVSCDWPALMKASDPISAALSGLFNDLSCNIPGLSASAIDDISKRLVLVDTRGVEGVKYFDTCPDFYSGKKETPDSDISSACLSSIQRKDIEIYTSEGEPPQTKELWSLWDFENFENAQSWPASSDISCWDLVARHVHDDNGKNVAEVRYLSLSALSGGGEQTPPDADTDVAGLSSIQTRTLTGDNGDVIQLYKFDDPSVETVYLSAQSRYDFVMRDNTDHCIKYANLSGIGGEVTLSGTGDTSHTGSQFKFRAALNTALSVALDANGNITVGVYYI